MKLFKLITIIIILTFYNTSTFSETKQDCSSFEADTGVKLYEKLKCKLGKEKGEGFGKKLKNLLKKKD